MASLLMDFGADPSTGDADGITPLMKAAELNLRAIAKDILSRHPQVLNQTCHKGSTALAFAAKSGAHEVLLHLLSQPWPKTGCCRELAVQEALVAGIQSGDVATLELILRDGDSNTNSPCLFTHEMPLNVAIKSGKRDICEVLLRQGKADVSLVASPLHLAVENGHWSVVELLISLGKCDVSAKDKKGRTALIVAAKFDHVALIELLLTHGANVDEADAEGVTALSWACFRGHAKAFECLLSRSANVNLRDKNHRTALHFAAIGGNVRIVVKLLEVKPSLLEVMDRNGLRPIDQAISSGHKDCIASLLRKGAKLGPATWSLAKDKPVIQ